MSFEKKVGQAVGDLKKAIGESGSLPESVLEPGEEVLLKAACEVLYPSGTSETGTLFLTCDRLVFVVSSGIFSKRHEITHFYYIDNISNARIEKGVFGVGKKLVIDWYHEGKRNVYRYVGIYPTLEEWISEIMKIKDRKASGAKFYIEVEALLKSQERTSFDEVKEIIKRCFKEKKEIDDENVVTVLRNFIQAGTVEGFIDKECRQFVHSTAYKQKTEVVQYNIATSFEFGKDGAILVRCPHCNTSKPQTERTSTIKCPGCGQTYTVPKKVLDMI